MEYYRTNELYHHGILGMKWGVRRYQNPDGTLTEAGKRRYLNPDGSLNYRGLKKQRKDAIERDPYGKTKREGGTGRSSDQQKRLRDDQIKYGSRGMERIKDRLASGQSYSKAIRPEKVRAGAAAASAILLNGALVDYALTGGRNTRAIINYGSFAVKKIMNNASGLLVGTIGVGRTAFDEHMKRNIFR